MVEVANCIKGAKMTDDFEPRIIAFLCNWCTYTGADLAGTSRQQYPPNVRIVRLMCSGAVDTTYVLQALIQGADGVLIGGKWVVSHPEEKKRRDKEGSKVAPRSIET